MAVDLQNSPTTPDADDKDPYRRVSGQLSNAEHGAADASTINSGGTGVEPKSFYNRSADKNGDVAPGTPSNANGGGLFSGVESPTKSFLGRFGISRRKAAGGGIGVLVGGALVFAGLTASGPLEVIHVGQILEKNFSKSNSDSENRDNSALRYWRAYKNGEFGETRVGILGSRSVAKTRAALEKNGITFDNNIASQRNGVSIETDKLKNTFSELNGASAENAKTILAERFNVNPDTISHQGGDKFYINERDNSPGAQRGLTRELVRVNYDPTAYGKTVAAIKFRPTAGFLGQGSILHPVSRAIGKQTQKQLTQAEANAKEKAAQKALTTESEAKAIPAEKDIKDSNSTGAKIVGSALLLTAVMCLARDSADKIVTVNRDAVAIPAATQATHVIAEKSQLETGQDEDAQHVGAVQASFHSSNGDSIFKAKAFRALEGADGQAEATGKDLSAEYQQAFSPQTTAGTIEDTLGGGTFGAIACSAPGKLFQAAIGIGLLVSNIADDGASVAAEAGLKAGAIAITESLAKNVESAVLLAATMTYAEKVAVGALSSSPIPDKVGTAVGGNLLAYGGRKAAEMSSLASGGISLNNNKSVMIAADDPASNQSFKSESMFARIFDARDYRSLTGRLSDMVSPSITANSMDAVNNFSTIGSNLPHLLAGLLPHALADTKDTDANYDWQFPQYGIPDSMLNDPALADPFANADAIAPEFDSETAGKNIPTDTATLKALDAAASSIDGSTTDGQTYINKAMVCFGDHIFKSTEGWDVLKETAVDPNSDSYHDANCADIGKSYAKASPDQQKWQRTIMFVNDIDTLKADACYQGDEQSCQEEGADAAAASEQTSATTTPTNSNSPTIVIDPGHAPNFTHTDTATDLDDSDAENDPEMQDVFDTAQLVQKKLTADGYNVVMTKKSVNDQVSLGQRAAIANSAHADLAISIHDQAGASGGIGFKAGNNIVYEQSVGTYRVAKNGKKVTFKNAQVAALSNKYGAIFQQQRQTAQGVSVKLQPNVGYDLGTRGLSAGNIWMVQLLSNVPWIYNEAGGNSAGQVGLNAADKQTYANGLIASIEKSVPITAAAATSNGGLPLNQPTGNADQVITVTATSTSSKTATLQEWDKQDQKWAKHGTAITANVGTAGLTSSPSESLSATPIGSFTLTQAFGVKPNPGTNLKYFKTNAKDWWDGNPKSKTYNQHVVRAKSPGGNSEQLSKITPLYNYAVVINANMNPTIAGKGSAFFLHVSDGGPTGGCVSIPQSDLVSLLRWLKPQNNPRILIGTP